DPNGHLGEERATLFSRWSGDHREYYICYDPWPEGPSFRSLNTRYAIAHLLAHILLEHPLRCGEGTPDQECEAHLLAAIILLLHPPPVERARPFQDEIIQILEEAELEGQHKWHLLTAFRNIVNHNSGGDRTLGWSAHGPGEYRGMFPDWMGGAQLAAQ